MNNSTWLDTMKGLVNKSDKDKKYLAEIARLEQLNLAVDENGEPVRYKSGNQASWPRYAEFLRGLIKSERDKIKPAVDAAVRDANNSHQQEVNRLNSKISSLNNQLMEKDKKIQELEDEENAPSTHQGDKGCYCGNLWPEVQGSSKGYYGTCRR